jgi:endogenous inhibitor of DNA gyrase (YacG/DUF329 family)
MYKSKPCAWCGTEFKASEKTQRFCSRRCSGASRRSKRRPLKCEHCGKVFTVQPAFQDKRRFCSDECKRAGLRGVAHQNFGKRKYPDPIVCAQCGTSFAVKHGKYYAKFCSRLCAQRYMADGNHPTAKPIGTRKLHIANKGKYKTWLIRAPSGRWVLEHRLLTEEELGRKLKRSEIVHHKNGNSLDNRRENRQVMTQVEHLQLHALAEKIGLSVIAANEWDPTVEGTGC